MTFWRTPVAFLSKDGTEKWLSEKCPDFWQLAWTSLESVKCQIYVPLKFWAKKDGMGNVCVSGAVVQLFWLGKQVTMNGWFQKTWTWKEKQSWRVQLISKSFHISIGNFYRTRDKWFLNFLSFKNKAFLFLFPQLFCRLNSSGRIIWSAGDSNLIFCQPAIGWQLPDLFLVDSKVATVAVFETIP